MIAPLRSWMKKNRMHWLTLVVHAGVVIWFAAHFVMFFVISPVDDVDWLTSVTGITGIRLLLLSLACTPLYIVTGWSPITRVRRPLGLYGFSSVVAHLLVFIVLFHAFFWSDIASDILTRNIYRAGFASLVLMIPLAVTSTRGWQRRLRKNWSRLHKLMYAICLLAALHFIWVDKRPNMLDVLLGGQFDVLFGQLGTRGYFELEVMILLLVIRMPAVRRRIVKFRNRLKSGPPRSKPAAGSVAAR